MSSLRVTSLRGRTVGVSPTLPDGAVVTGIVTATGVNATGVITATSFVGSGEGLTGVASTDNIITGTAATFNNVVKVGTAITLDATSGIITAVNGFVGNLTGNATGLTGTPDIAVRNITGVAATFSGVLTYEDVTNIDSVGIVTARTGIKVLAGGINAVGVVTGTSFTGDGSQLSGVGGENDITSSLFI